jgi:hypothetical protein
MQQEAVKKRTPQRFAYTRTKKSIDCRIEATLKGLRRLLSLSLNSFRLKRRSLACIGWFLWEKKHRPETCATASVLRRESSARYVCSTRPSHH